MAADKYQANRADGAAEPFATRHRRCAGMAEVPAARQNQVAVRGLCYKRRPSIGKVDDALPGARQPVCGFGPAPVKPIMRAKLHYDWHWYWDTAQR